VSRNLKSLMLFIGITLLLLSGCGLISTPEPTATATATSTFLPTHTPIPPTPTITPTPTEIPFFVDATVWTGNVQAPILIYHYFGRDGEADIPTTWMRFEDFKKQLQLLYDNGFSLYPWKIGFLERSSFRKAENHSLSPLMIFGGQTNYSLMRMEIPLNIQE